MAESNRMSRLGADERNIARLVPVVALNRVPSELTGWTKMVVIDNLSTISITCAGNGQVVPHGIDGDTMFALTAIFVLQGKPADGYIEVSVADLCNLVGIKRGAKTYERLEESIYRLRHVSFEVSEAWASLLKNGTINWRSISFGIINSLEKVDYEVNPDAKPGIFRPTTLLRIGLSPELVKSIQAGHIRSIDLDLYGSLEQPLSRLLYRTLEEQRHLGATKQMFQVPLMNWGDHLGLRTITRDDQGSVQFVKVRKTEVPVTEVIRHDKIRRALDPAHEELRQKGYLRGIEYVGRGKDQMIHYEFGTPQTPVDLELIALLTQRGMSPKVSEQQVRTHGAAAVNRAVAIFDARKAAGYSIRSPGGLLTDILVNPDKYVLLEAPASVKPGSAKVVRPVVDVEVAELTVEAKRKTTAFVMEGWAKRQWLTGQQHAHLLALVKAGRLDDAKMALLGLADLVAVQKFVMDTLAHA